MMHEWKGLKWIDIDEAISGAPWVPKHLSTTYNVHLRLNLQINLPHARRTHQYRRREQISTEGENRSVQKERTDQYRRREQISTEGENRSVQKERTDQYRRREQISTGGISWKTMTDWQQGTWVLAACTWTRLAGLSTRKWLLLVDNEPDWSHTEL